MSIVGSTNSPNLVYTEDWLRRWQVRCQWRFAALSAVRSSVCAPQAELAGIRSFGMQRDHKQPRLVAAVLPRVVARVVAVVDVEEGQRE